MTNNITFRFATSADASVILELIRELAAYEHAEDEVEATPEILQEWLFERRAAEVLLAEVPNEGVVGMAVFFQNFSTWTGKGGMYLEDFVVRAGKRGLGVGRAIVAELAHICEERGWVRLDWACLDWNAPSLGFYQHIGAARMDEWVHHRLSGEALVARAGEAAGHVTGGAAGHVTGESLAALVGEATAERAGEAAGHVAGGVQ